MEEERIAERIDELICRYLDDDLDVEELGQELTDYAIELYWQPPEGM